MRRLLRRTIAAPVEEVWRTLTDHVAVTAWAGVTPARLSPGYPVVGEHALWWDHGVLLHDEILDVQPERRLHSRLRRGSLLVLEDYRLHPLGPRTTRLLTEWRGHPGLVIPSATAAAAFLA